METVDEIHVSVTAVKIHRSVSFGAVTTTGVAGRVLDTEVGFGFEKLQGESSAVWKPSYEIPSEKVTCDRVCWPAIEP